MEWTPVRHAGADLPHYKAYAANVVGEGGWLSGASDPWSAVGYALNYCKGQSSVRSRCRIEHLGDSPVQHLDRDELIAAAFEYYADDDASFDNLSELAVVRVANRADGVLSVVAAAVVPQQGRRYWALELGDTFEDAERAALSACRHEDCIVVDYLIEAECAIAVAGDTQIFWGSEDDIDSIMDVCLIESNDCEIIKRVCSQ